MKQVINARDALPADAIAIAEIYNHYVRQTTITFEEDPLPSKEINRRIQEVLSFSFPWLVAEVDGEIVGYAYASKWKARSAYRFSVETAVYVSPHHLRRGIGFQLYSRLLPALNSRGAHVAIGVIALPNSASIGLHEKFGFEKAAHFKEVGFKFDRWIDVGHWHRIL
jgi:phosphinothricin acetyltransferase